MLNDSGGFEILSAAHRLVAADNTDLTAMHLYQVTDAVNRRHLKWSVTPPGRNAFSLFGFKEFPLEPIYRANWALHLQNLPETVSLRGKVMEMIDRQWRPVDSPVADELLSAARWLVERLPGPLNNEEFAGASSDTPWFIDPCGRFAGKPKQPPQAYQQLKRALYVSAVVGDVPEATHGALAAVTALARLVFDIGEDISPRDLEVDLVFFIDGPLGEGSGWGFSEAPSHPKPDSLVVHAKVRNESDESFMNAFIREALEFAQTRIGDYCARYGLSADRALSTRRALTRVLDSLGSGPSRFDVYSARLEAVLRSRYGARLRRSGERVATPNLVFEFRYRHAKVSGTLAPNIKLGIVVKDEATNETILNSSRQLDGWDQIDGLLSSVIAEIDKHQR